MAGKKVAERSTLCAERWGMPAACVLMRQGKGQRGGGNPQVWIAEVNDLFRGCLDQGPQPEARTGAAHPQCRLALTRLQDRAVR
jgi:hypothetical protein